MDDQPLANRRVRILCLAAACAALLSPLLCAAEYDVPYVPTPQEVVEHMLQMANVGPDDYVIDLGSGDGRIVLRAAQKHGARALGVDLDPDHIASSKEKAAERGLSKRAAFRVENLFDTDLSRATVVTMYLLPDVNLRLRPRLLAQLKPGSRIVSHSFDLGDWKPDQHVEKLAQGAVHTIYYWVVPANVQGTWTVTDADGAPLRVVLKQRFQEVEGRAVTDNGDVPLRDVRLQGDRIAFTVDTGTPRVFEGRVRGDAIEGVSTAARSDAGARTAWRARREMSAAQ